MAVKIITDSVSDLPGDLKSAYGIEVLPLMVNFGEVSYRDGIDLTPEAFFEKLKTAQTAANDFPGQRRPVCGML
jgi:fatty acid-binding protein DegV